MFLVSLHEDQASYEAVARANATWLARLMPLLVDNQGPTFYGPVLAHHGHAHGTDEPLPSAIKVGARHS